MIVNFFQYGIAVYTFPAPPHRKLCRQNRKLKKISSRFIRGFEEHFFIYLIVKTFININFSQLAKLKVMTDETL